MYYDSIHNTQDGTPMFYYKLFLTKLYAYLFFFGRKLKFSGCFILILGGLDMITQRRGHGHDVRVLYFVVGQLFLQGSHFFFRQSSSLQNKKNPYVYIKIIIRVFGSSAAVAQTKSPASGLYTYITYTATVLSFRHS